MIRNTKQALRLNANLFLGEDTYEYKIQFSDKFS